MKHHDYGFTALPKQMPPDRAPISKAPANGNEHDDARDGQFEYWARCAVHDLLSIKELEKGRELIAMYITDWIEGRRHHG